MKYEFVDFYPFQRDETKNKFALGTCHICFIDVPIDIRGILVLRNKKGFVFKMPKRSQIDPDTQKKVDFPVVYFYNDRAKKEFFDFLFEEGVPVIREKLETQKVDGNRSSKRPSN